MPDKRKLEIELPENMPNEWFEKGFTCVVEFTPKPEGQPEAHVTCEPLESKAEDKLVGRVIHRIIKVRGNILGTWKDVMPKWMKQCIMSGGLPMFRTRYAGMRWGENMVMATCYGEEEPPLSGGFFIEVPEEDIAKMEEATGDWRWIVEKYGDSELKAYVAEKYKPPKVGLLRLLKELGKRHGED
ncbi:MAG: hypothetical protein QW692_01850 [Nitrososphaerota archaeon]